MDTGLLGLVLLDCKSAQLENLVAIELIRRYGTENVYFFENNVEIDFYVPSEKCILITNSEEAPLNCDGIEIDVVPVWKWLLEGEGKRK